MIWGDQWVCGCGWHNLELRRKCRNCGLPRALRIADEPVEAVIEAVHGSAGRPTSARSPVAERPLTIRELADRFGLTLRALRFWEGKRLITPSRSGKTRFYDTIQVERAEKIATWSDAGFALWEIRDMLGMNDPSPYIGLRLPALKRVAADRLAAVAHLERHHG